MKKVVKGERNDLFKVKKQILLQAGMFITLMRVHHYNRILEISLEPLQHDSHVVLRARVIRDAMIMKNYGLAVRVAQRHYKDFIPMDDLKQYGAEGLIMAVDGFDPQKGHKFSSYAGKCISQTISRSIVENETFIRLPEHLAKEMKRKSREETRAQVRGVEPPQSSKKRERTVPEIAFSVDDCKEGDDGDKIASCLVSESILSPEDYVLRKLKEKNTAQAVTLLKENLSKNDWFILSKYFGLSEGEEPVTVSAIARKLSKSRQWTDRMRCRAIDASRKILFRGKISAPSVL